MTAGSDYRRRADRGDALALHAIARVRELREAAGRPEAGGTGQAYILTSLKNPEELALLRSIYGVRLVAVGAHCPRRLRLESLVKRFTSSGHDEDRSRELAEEFIRRDADEGERLGQNISRTFHQADCFVEVGDHLEPDELEHQIDRITRIFFGDPFHTPTREERGMFMAAGAAAQSAELTRQVGASVMRDDGSIISVGCNEVPRFGGGVYWEGDSPDHREMTRSHDSAAEARTAIARSIASRLLRGDTLGSVDEEELTAQVEAELRGVTEFGRASHAEMTALFSAAAAEASVVGATVLTTTFPCHTCTRYMLTAGISRVVYVSPYDRSRAADLYPEAIEVDPATRSEDSPRMKVQPFIGIAPRRYLEWFGTSWREDSPWHQKRSGERGEVLEFDPLEARPLAVDESGLMPSKPEEREYFHLERRAVEIILEFDQ
jgi:deoxycytidylate deaminase